MIENRKDAKAPTFEHSHNRGYGADAMRIVKIVDRFTSGLTVTEILGHPRRTKIDARTALTNALAALTRGLIEDDRIGRLPQIPAVGYYLAVGASPLIRTPGPFDLDGRDPYDDFKDAPINRLTAILVADMAEALTYVPEKPIDYYARLCFYYLKVIAMAPGWDALVEIASYAGTVAGEAQRLRNMADLAEATAP